MPFSFSHNMSAWPEALIKGISYLCFQTLNIATWGDGRVLLVALCLHTRRFRHNLILLHLAQPREADGEPEKRRKGCLPKAKTAKSLPLSGNTGSSR